MAEIDKFVIKSKEEILEDYLRTISEGLALDLGIENANVSKGTLDYVRGVAIAEVGASIYQMIQIKSDAQMADSAIGDDLLRIAKIYKLGLREAGGSSGPIILSASITTPIVIPTGAQLIDSTGLSYKITIGASYSHGDEMPIEATDTGVNTNLAEGDSLRWVSPPPFANKTALVGPGGLTGGVDAETEEGLRTRLLEKIRNPPGGGNYSELNQTAEDSTVAVQKAFTYPAANGPATVHTAVIAAPTATNKERDVDITVLNTKIRPAIQAIVPEYFELLVTTVQNQAVDVSIGISLPFATTASLPGPGGGWLDGSIWPVRVSTGRCIVSAVISPSTFTVTCDSEPAIGSHICWLSPLNWQIYHGVVLSYTGTAPAVTVTLDVPFIGIAVGDYISPDAELMDDYIATLLDLFANLGPGQKTNQAGILPRAYRRPLINESYPSDLNLQNLRRLSDNHSEIATLAYLYRSAITPNFPTLITDGPFVLTPRNLAFYPLD